MTSSTLRLKVDTIQFISDRWQSKFLLGGFVSGNTLDKICDPCNHEVFAFIILSFWYLIIHKILAIINAVTAFAGYNRPQFFVKKCH